MTYHWCNEHPEHATGPGVTTTRAWSALTQAIMDAPPGFLAKLESLVVAGILSGTQAQQVLRDMAR